METMYEQTSFLENNDAINATEVDNTQKTFTAANTTERQYTKKPFRPRQYMDSRRPHQNTNEFPYSRKPYPNKTQNQGEVPFVRRSLPNNAVAGSEGNGDFFVRRSLPNKAFDQEYMTEWVREVKFLADKGIPYTYVKRTPDYGISQFKYKKTSALFEALKEFYSQVEIERSNLASADEVQEVLKGAGITIQRGRNGSIKFVKDEPESEMPATTEDVIE